MEDSYIAPRHLKTCGELGTVGEKLDSRQRVQKSLEFGLNSHHFTSQYHEGSFMKSNLF